VFSSECKLYLLFQRAIHNDFQETFQVSNAWFLRSLCRSVDTCLVHPGRRIHHVISSAVLLAGTTRYSGCTSHLQSGQHPESPRCLAVSPLSVTRSARCSSFVPGLYWYVVGPLATLPIVTWLLPCLQCCLNSLVAKPPPHAATLPHLTAAPASLTGPPLEKRLRAPRQRS
jgi:hypothetical protein